LFFSLPSKLFKLSFSVSLSVHLTHPIVFVEKRFSVFNLSLSFIKLIKASLPTLIQPKATKEKKRLSKLFLFS
jgi:hypothetical protein